jgi:uncharacterized membrane protein
VAEFFLANKTFIIFLHVISGVVWVGGMIAMRYAAHYSFMAIEDPKMRLERISHALSELFSIVLPFVIILIVTAIFMIKGYDLSNSDYSAFGHAKEGIWSVMFLNLIVMMRRRNKAQKALEADNVSLAKEQLGFIGKYQVPANIALGVIAIFLGATLSSTF